MSAAISPDRMAARDAMAALLLPGGAKRGHIWGRSGKADAKMIHGESQTLSFLPDSAAYLNVLITFAERLRESHADQSADGRYWMENIAGNLSQNLLRKTGKLHHEDERELLKQAETFVPVFEDIACILAKVGAGRWILSNCPGRSCAIGNSGSSHCCGRSNFNARGRGGHAVRGDARGPAPCAAGGLRVAQ